MLLLISDYPNFLTTAKDYLQDQGNYQVTAFSNYQDVLPMLSSGLPDCIIGDLRGRHQESYAFVKSLRDNPRTRSIPFIFLHSPNGLPDSIQALSAGCDRYLMKPFLPKNLLTEIKTALSSIVTIQPTQELSSPVNDSVRLTPTEKKVLALIVQGLSNREIAANLSISLRTAETHVSNILGKTGLPNRTKLAAWALGEH
ncbi:MAG: response regulator transcription factor [Coleofasciculus sp. B1-GNL1-01]|uniref:response regulator transcription factor n=1 Tax=Coleofasciculus sp. B1-GNL1-01 TaxID=3068484 RepID=UPI0032F3AC9A